VLIRNLNTLTDFAAVVAMQRAIWGADYDDVVPLSIFAATLKRGGILLGSENEGGLTGFVFSFPGLKDEHPMHWSHMLGVMPAHRRAGIGYRLKLAQREHVLRQGLDLIEWTFDPLLATNAALNVARLGATVEEYLENIYGESTSPLHRGVPTDRFVASWRIASDHVERRLAADGLADGLIVARDAGVAAAPVVNETRLVGGFRVPPAEPHLDLDARRVQVEIPFDFDTMRTTQQDLALGWRMATRRIFTAYFSRGYRVVDFGRDRERRRAGYLLEFMRRD
jgi:predicted GNAT superfamily acetyltransferase